MSCDLPKPEKSQPKEAKLDLPEGVPPLRSFYLYMTNGCNLCCKHCWVNPTYEKGTPTPGDYIDFEQLKHAVEVAKTIGPLSR